MKKLLELKCNNMLLPANLLFAEWVFLFHFQSSLPNAGEHVSCIYC